MRVLLSIKPEYAERIFDCSKKFEFRKAIFKDTTVTTIVVYASSPTQRVIGEFEIDRILEDEPQNLWQRTSRYAGIDEESFNKYFATKDIGYAIKIKKVTKYKKPLLLSSIIDSVPPQSFRYLD